MGPTSAEPPKVFISYSHDSVDHKKRVLALCDRLRQWGINSNIDQYEQAPEQGWARWMNDQINWADFVLMVITENYSRRFGGQEIPGKGLGVIFETTIILNAIYDGGGKKGKFIPVLLSAQDAAHIPGVLRDEARYEVDTENGFIELYRLLTNQPKIIKPILGKLVHLARKELIQDTLETSKSPLPLTIVEDINTEIITPSGYSSIIEETDSWTLRINWQIHGPLAPYLNGRFIVNVFFESIGPGSDGQLCPSQYLDLSNASPDELRKYSIVLNIESGALLAGMYRLVQVITHEFASGAPGQLAMFNEGTILQVMSRG